MTYQPPKLTWGTSGVRGKVEDFSDFVAYVTGVALTNFFTKYDPAYSESKQIVLAHDRRPSSPRIAAAIKQGIEDQGGSVLYIGEAMTPEAAYYAMSARTQPVPSIIVTGSHIPEDRNGIKPYLSNREVLKSDESAVNAEYDVVVQYEQEQFTSRKLFNDDGSFTQPITVGEVDDEATEFYISRFEKAFPGKPLTGKNILVYQYSAVGRDTITSGLTALGATVHPVGRSDAFSTIDTEAIESDVLEQFRSLLKAFKEEHNTDAFALVSTDPDGDRPIVIDENSEFIRGDILTAVAAKKLGIDFFAITSSSNSVVERILKGVDIRRTKIGSPYIVEAMQTAEAQGYERVAGAETNGGFLTQTDITTTNNTNNAVLKSLPTRDALTSIVLVLIQACEHESVSALIKPLQTRFTSSGFIDNFPTEHSKHILATLTPAVEFLPDKILIEVDYTEKVPKVSFADGTEIAAEGQLVDELHRIQLTLEKYFTKDLRFGAVTRINYIDCVKIFFSNQDVAYMRPSGNAPQFRIYAESDSQGRSDRICELVLSEKSDAQGPVGIYRQLEGDLVS